MIIIKKASKKDSQILAQIFSVLYSQKIKSEYKIKSSLVKKTKEYYLCSTGKRPVGAISLKFNNKQCELETIAVRQKGKGYGSRLLQFAENSAVERGCQKIWCHSLEQHKVKGFYLKCGWEEEEYIVNYYPGKNSFTFSKILGQIVTK